MSSRTGRYRIKPTNTRSPRKVIAIAVGALVVVVAVAATVLHALQPKGYQLKGGTVLTMDPGSRTGKVEYVHPKTGKTMQAEAEVPAECLIFVDDQRAELRDLRLGDKFDAYILIYPSITGSARVVAQEVRVKRAATQPATAPGSATTKPASGT